MTKVKIFDGAVIDSNLIEERVNTWIETNKIKVSNIETRVGGGGYYGPTMVITVTYIE